MNFDLAFERLIGHEGGYLSSEEAERQGDPGGETKFGISKRAYPREDIKGMTLERAKTIYARDYWGPAGCDRVPEGIRFELFDMAVNSGVREAVRTLQKAVGTVEDGVLGPKTLRAAEGTTPDAVIRRFNGARLMFMTTLTVWPKFSRGWARRIASNLLA